MLRKFGFSQYESQVFEALVSSNEPLDATLIVKYSGVPKAKIYEVLTRMIEKGLVLDSVSEKKKLYTALPLNLVIEKLTKEFEENISQLKNNTHQNNRSDDRVWSLKVDSSIQLQCKQLLQEAEHSIQISVWKEDFQEFLPILIEKEQSGVKVEALVVGDVQESRLSSLHILSPNEEHRRLEKNRLIIIDEETILFAGVENDSWQAMLTKSKPFVKFFVEFFYHDVVLTKVTKKYEDQLMNDEEFKHLLLRLRY
ncbi:TrmB family transcriptional regulator [Bacillus sp. AFS076308]|uniref:TrmB family transcriptional regulator n=1 Tax=unclassified Bacillus (in: firmicutes) TaxID=185979 RepID=UPI000BF3A9CE|nr:MULTISPECIES: TrmB family transcriptional regulator [unclassified Bacillus (in: firmicutes)]PFO08033.1 TrmB family transcriptional regulator [Bacillus sp. AFS076308]PGV49278.1 TrmB family transcriptional regulator [Bacillus sp. AFS037270]